MRDERKQTTQGKVTTADFKKPVTAEIGMDAVCCPLSEFHKSWVTNSQNVQAQVNRLGVIGAAMHRCNMLSICEHVQPDVDNQQEESCGSDAKIMS